MQQNNSIQKISALLVDDEIDACENLKSIILNHCNTDLEIIGVTITSTEAEQLIEKYKPQVVFLDIELSTENAFQFLSRLKQINFEIIFITAYDQYAIKALKIGAIDYVLKPVEISELQNAILKLKNKVLENGIQYQNDYRKLSKQFKEKTQPNQIVLKDQSRIEIVDIANIFYIEANSAYSKIHFSKSDNSIHCIVMSHHILEYEEMLASSDFYRIHKSYLVNLKQIDHIFTNEQRLVLKNNEYLPISRRRYSDFIHHLNNYGNQY